MHNDNCTMTISTEILFTKKKTKTKNVTLIINRTRILRCKNWRTVYKHLTDWYARCSLEARFRRHNSHEPNRANTNFGWPILISAECDGRLSRSKFEQPFCRGTQLQFLGNTCSEDDFRSRIFGTFIVKFLAYLPLLRFSNI